MMVLTIWWSTVGHTDKFVLHNRWATGIWYIANKHMKTMCCVLRLNSELFNRESFAQINHTTLPAYPEEIYMRDPNDFISTEVIVVGFNFL